LHWRLAQFGARGADVCGMKVVLTVVVFLALAVMLAVATVFTPRPDADAVAEDQ